MIAHIRKDQVIYSFQYEDTDAGIIRGDIITNLDEDQNTKYFEVNLSDPQNIPERYYNGEYFDLLKFQNDILETFQKSLA